MKKCTKCNLSKPRSEYRLNQRYTNGLYSLCKMCEAEYAKATRRTIDGRLVIIYSAERSSSKRRGHPMPEYTSKELKEWGKNNDRFVKIFNEWVSSGYLKLKTPTIDRIDNKKHYTLDNIQALTLSENSAKAGRSENKYTPVRMFDMDGKLLRSFEKASEAFAWLDKKQDGSISKVCRGKTKSAFGFKWCYADESLEV